MTKTLSKAVMVFCLVAVPCVEPAWACGPSGPVGMAFILGLAGLLIGTPALLSSAGTVAAFRARRHGLSLGKVLLGILALACEAGVAALTGLESLVGTLALGLGALQLALFAMAAVYGPVAALPGKLTILSEQALALRV